MLKQPENPLEPKVALLDAQIRAHAPLLVAYSGGVDSAYLLAEASRVLGDAALGVIADDGEENTCLTNDHVAQNPTQAKTGTFPYAAAPH